MDHQSLRHQFLSIITLFVMLFNPVLQSIALAATPARPVAPILANDKPDNPQPPSELAQQWPAPQMPENQPDIDFPGDPVSRAMEAVLGSSLAGEVGAARLEPLSSNPSLGVELPQRSAPLPVLVDPLDKMQVDAPRLPASSLADFSSLAVENEDDVSPTSVADLFAATPPIKGPNEIAAVLGDQSKEPELSLSVVSGPDHTEETSSARLIEAGPQAESTINLSPAASSITYTVHLPVVLGNGPEASPDAEVIVTPQDGGTLNSEDGSLKVAVPPGAVISETVIQYTALPDGQRSLSQDTNIILEFSLDARQIADGSPVRLFRYPLQIFIQLDNDFTLGAGEYLHLATWDTIKQEWQSLPTTFDPASQTVTAQTLHFTNFGLFSSQNTTAAVQLIQPILAEPSTAPPNAFAANTVTFPYTTGRVILSSTPDGSGDLWTDDAVSILVTRPDGTQDTYGYQYNAYGPGITPTRTEDVTHLFLPGNNTVYIEVIDLQPPSRGTSGYYLVPESAISDTTLLPPRPTPAEIARWRNLGHQNYQKYGADPVSFSTGNYVYQNTLFQMPGPGGLDVDFTLTYNAQDGRDDLFGVGWAFPYNARTQVYSDSSVSVVLHDGRTFHYDWNGSTFVPPAGVHDQLTETAEGWQLTMLDGTELAFADTVGGLGVMTRWQDRQGNSLTFEYDLTSLPLTPTIPLSAAVRPPLESMTDAAGRIITFESDAGNHITKVSLPDGRDFSFAYSSNGDLTSITDPNGGSRRFEYDSLHRLIKHWDPEDIMYLENIYDDQDRVIEQIDASGSHMFIAYDDANQITTFTDNLGNVTRYTFDRLKRVTAIEDALGNRETYTYDDDYNLAAFTDKRGQTWQYSYDGRGNRLTETDPLGNITTYSYNTANDLTAMTGPLGRTTSYSYDAAGNLLSTTRADATTLTYTYDGQGNLLTSADGNGHTTSYSYNSNGDLIVVLDPESNRTQYDYDAVGRQTKMTDANNHTAQFAYDGNDNIIEITDPKGAKTSFDYDGNDNLTRLVDRLGRTTTYQYDENLKLVAETDPAGSTTSYDYDLMYNLTLMTDPLGRETKYEYDALYRLTAVEDALGGRTRYAYDENGNLTQKTDANDHATSYAYDPLNRQIKMTDALAGETSYQYDAAGRLISETNPRGAVTAYEYDLLDRLTLTRDAEGGVWTIAYDNAGNTTSAADANGQTTTYSYDDANRLLAETNAAGHVTGYSYDGVGNLLTLTDALGRVTTYAYDENENLTQVTDALGGLTRLAYDAEDNLTDRTDALDRVTHYEYDALDRVTRRVENYDPAAASTADVNVTTTYQYDPLGNVLTRTDANGNPIKYTYDELYRLVREEDAESQVTSYAYDAGGNLLSQTNPRGFITAYAYDALDRLITLTDAGGNIWRYAYDARGNLVDTTDPLGVVTYNSYDMLDRLTSTTQNYVSGSPATVDQNVTTSFDYDPVGNRRFVYDPRGGYVTEHRYDAINRRVLTVDKEGGQTGFVYDAVDNLIELIDGNNHRTAFSYDDLDRRVAITNAEGHTVRFVYDAIGNLLELIDARGNSTTFSYDGMNRLILRVDALLGQWRYSYDAMGNLLQEIDANDHANDTYIYDAVYRLLSRTDAEGHATIYSYDANGNRLTMTDGNSHTTTYAYDALDRLALLTNAENEATQYEYDPLGNQTRVIEADGIATRYDYDPLYRLVTVNENDRPGQPESADVNVDTHYSYDEVGNLLAIRNAEENDTRFSYDGMNRLIQEVDALGNTWDYDYDPVGNRTARIDALRQRTDYSYYPDDQLQQIDYYDGTSVAYTYDENNNRLTMLDRLGTTSWTYDALDRVTAVTDAFGRRLGYAYDPVGNRTGLTYPDGRTVTYAYYDNDWLLSMTDPAGNRTVYDRDGVGQMTRTLNPNNTIHAATYDKANRLLTLRNSQIGGKVNSAFTYTYNEVGHRTRMVAEYAWRNPAVVTSNYSYDGLRRLIRDADSEGRWTDYTFDRVGNRLSLTTNDDSLSPRPFDDKTLLYSYNDINQLLTVVGDTRPGQGSVKRETNVAQTLYAFRHEVTAQRGKHISAAAADDLLGLADALLTDLESKPAPNAGQVTAAIAALRSQVSAYRSSGDIDRDGIETSLLAKLNKADQANSGNSGALQTTTYRYDANGNRINKEFPGPQGPQIQGADYAYDPENRLITARDYQMNQQGNRVDRAITTLDYDGSGRRLVKAYDPKTGSGGVKRTEYVFDGLDPVAEYEIQTGQHTNYYRGDRGRMVSLQHFPSGSAGQMFWFHYDGLGSTSGLTKQNGNSHHNYRYEPYGQIEMPPGNFAAPHNHYTFTGQELDKNMGLYEFYARAYDYETGTWVQQDVYRGRLQEPETLHRYGYVGNSPITYADMYGYSWLEAFVGVIGGAVVGAILTRNPVGIALGAAIGGTWGYQQNWFSDSPTFETTPTDNTTTSGSEIGGANETAIEQRDDIVQQVDKYSRYNKFIYPLNKKETDYYKFKTPYASGNWKDKLHPGVDFHEGYGAEVKAVGDGKVVRNQIDKEGYGQYVVLEHTLVTGTKVYSLYGHLERGSTSELEIGSIVEQGKIVGKEGQSGNANGITHLHFEIKKTNEMSLYPEINSSNINNYFYDPYAFIDNPESRFVPLRE